LYIAVVEVGSFWMRATVVDDDGDVDGRKPTIHWYRVDKNDWQRFG